MALSWQLDMSEVGSMASPTVAFVLAFIVWNCEVRAVKWRSDWV